MGVLYELLAVASEALLRIGRATNRSCSERGGQRPASGELEHCVRGGRTAASRVGCGGFYRRRCNGC